MMHFLDKVPFCEYVGGKLYRWRATPYQYSSWAKVKCFSAGCVTVWELPLSSRHQIMMQRSMLTHLVCWAIVSRIVTSIWKSSRVTGHEFGLGGNWNDDVGSSKYKCTCYLPRKFLKIIIIISINPNTWWSTRRFSRKKFHLCCVLRDVHHFTLQRRVIIFVLSLFV